jgi:hypothetical protein
MGKRNQSRGFFRVWIALSLIWIMFVCGAAIVDLVRTLRLPPEPPTFAFAALDVAVARSRHCLDQARVCSNSAPTGGRLATLAGRR